MRRNLAFIAYFLFVLTTHSFAQPTASLWHGTWKNIDPDKHTQILQAEVKGDSVYATWYTNDNWRLYKVFFEGVISKKGKNVKGVYRYEDKSERGTFDWELLEFKKSHYQYNLGLKYYFFGHLGTDRANMRNWNASKRSDETNESEVNDFLAEFYKERPKVLTKNEAIELVRATNPLKNYRLLPKDPDLPIIAATDLIRTCKSGTLVFKGPNRYIIGDFYFYIKDGAQMCAVYISGGSSPIVGYLDRSTKNASESETTREYKMNGSIGDDIMVSSLTITGNKVKIQLYGPGMDCTLEN